MLLRSLKQDRSLPVLFVLAIVVGLLLGIGTVYITPAGVSAVLITIFSALIILRKPEYAILALVTLTSTFLDTSSNPGFSIAIGTIYLTDILVFLGILMIIVRAIIEPEFKIIHTPIDIPIILFIVFAYLSTFIAIMQSSLILQEVLHEMRIVANYLVFFMVTNLIRNDNQMKNLLRGLVILGGVVAGGTIIQYGLGESIQILPGRVETLNTEGVTFASVTRIIPPGYSLMFVVFVALSVTLIFGRFRTRNQILIFPWVLTGLGVLLSFKRHLWIAVMVSFLLIIYLGRRRELNRVVNGGLVILFLSLLVVFFLYNFTGPVGPHFIDSSLDRLLSLFRPDTYTNPTSSLRWRDFEYQYGIPQFLSHPIFGLGLGAKYRPYIIPKDWEGFDGRAWIHNGNLWLLVKTGLLGYLPLITVILISLYRGFKYWRLIPETWKRYLVLGCALSILGMIIGSFIEPTWMRLSWTTIIGIVLGVNELLIKEVT